MRAGPGVRSATVTVGRETETDILARAMGGARAGRSGCTLLVGEGGVGKSRLLQTWPRPPGGPGSPWPPGGRRSRRPRRSA